MSDIEFKHPNTMVVQRVIPKDGREITTPIMGCSSKIVSCLYPTDGITDSYPIIGTSTFGALNSGEKPDPNYFSDYVLTSIDRSNKTGFSRLSFVKPMTDATTLVPFKPNTYQSKMETWPAILLKFRQLEDPQLKVKIDTAFGTKLVPRVYTQWEYIEGVTVPCKVVERHFVSDHPFDKRQLKISPNVTEATDVSWDIGPLGKSGSMGPCLHEEIKVRAAHPREGFSGSPYSQIYPATGVTTWTPFVYDFETKQVDQLYYGIERTVIPPNLPASIRKSL